MKVFAIILTGLVIFSLLIPSEIHAAKLAPEFYSTARVFTWIARYVKPYLAAYPVGITIRPGPVYGDQGRVGGDADDYANGKGNGGESSKGLKSGLPAGLDNDGTNAVIEQRNH